MLAFLALAAGCSDADSADAQGTCMGMIKFAGRTYMGTYKDLPLKTGDRLGSTRPEPCNDTGSSRPVSKEPTLKVYRVIGIDAKLAVGVGDTVQDVRLYAVRDGKKVPRDVEVFIEHARRTKDG
ncbi:DUF6281 family protein [Streptomyces longhuiensis]|uniref:DUF6281 family protein n=1 Tax=Streptomyces longhuiensis TaxID=2880933 RepID=UPI001D0B0045|nr:DUF6281 family protein [Streptomyces longhuiensis]UDM05531.1 DUF6281 family protein [Streptomyces longhuiensis]